MTKVYYAKSLLDGRLIMWKTNSEEYIKDFHKIHFQEYNLIQLKLNIGKGFVLMSNLISIEERVEDYIKNVLDSLGVKRYSKTESINKEIKTALSTAKSKTGGDGGNFPDIQVLLDNKRGRTIPVMFEIKGKKKRLEKLDKKGNISKEYKDVNGYAVNGAYHYGLAILEAKDSIHDECLIIGINASDLKKDLELKGYYLSKRNGNIPKYVKEISIDLQMLTQHNVDELYKIFDNLCLTTEEQNNIVKSLEESLDSSIKIIHQKIYENKDLRVVLTTNEKLYLLCGLIMAGLSSEGVPDLCSSDLKGSSLLATSDGFKIVQQIKVFLQDKDCKTEVIDMIISLLKPVFYKEVLWKTENGISILKDLFVNVKREVIPYLNSNFRLDFMGRIMNCLNDWASIDNDIENDVVLTPRYVTQLMAQLCRVNKDSKVLDTTMGSGGFLVTAIDMMIRDAQIHIKDKKEYNLKINNIKQNQIMGIEILNNIYLLAVLNMILMGGFSNNLLNMNSHNYTFDFEPDVFLLNPPYSEEGKGLIFVEEATRKMKKGYACVLIQESAGSGQGAGWSKKLLTHNTLLASIKMPKTLFGAKASVNTAIYLFKVNSPHDPNNLVKFINFKNDGYKRGNRRKVTEEINLKNVDHAESRYSEVVNRVLGKKTDTEYYTKENGLYIEDTITLNGDDWSFDQHRNYDVRPSANDFLQTILAYLDYKIDDYTFYVNKIELNEVDDCILNKYNWNYFTLEDIFEKINTAKMKGKVSDFPEIRSVEYPIPLRTACQENRGCKVYGKRADCKTILKNVISISGNGTGIAFYNSDDFAILQDSYALTLVGKDKIDLKTGLFLETCLNKLLVGHFNWNNKAGWKRIKDCEIALPVNENGEPAWVFMQEYIENILDYFVKQREQQIKEYLKLIQDFKKTI